MMTMTWERAMRKGKKQNPCVLVVFFFFPSNSGITVVTIVRVYRTRTRTATPWT